MPSKVLTPASRRKVLARSDPRRFDTLVTRLMDSAKGVYAMKAWCLPPVGRLLALAALMLAVFASVAAFAQTDYPTTPTTAEPRSREPLTVTAPRVVSPSTSGGTLAFTGGNIALLVELGLVAAVGGFVLVRVGRRAKLTR